MSKYFLVSRIIILMALLFILFAVVWGWTHSSKPAASGDADHLEKYAARKPGGNTTLFFVISLSLGMVLVSFSIWLEWMRTRCRSDGVTAAEKPPPFSGAVQDTAGGETPQDASLKGTGAFPTAEPASQPGEGGQPEEEAQTDLPAS